MEPIVISLGIAICGFIIGNVLGFREGLARGQEIVKDVHNL